MIKKSFIGVAELYDESIYINTNTGEGLGKALEKIDPLLCKMASKTYMNDYSFDDIKHELVLIAIEGIRAYNPGKDVKLSTFLHIHLRNKLISKIRSLNKLSNDASLVGTSNDNNDSCRKVRSEINFSQITDAMSSNDGDSSIEFIDTIAEDEGMFGAGLCSREQSDFRSALSKMSKSIDSKTSKILELVCLKDYSIKDAAAEVGLSGWAASMRLKNLNKNRIIKDIFERKIQDDKRR